MREGVTSVTMRRRRGAVIAFFQGLLKHAAVERQLGDQELESVALPLQFRGGLGPLLLPAAPGAWHQAPGKTREA